MPETNITSCGCRFAITNACLIAFRIPKSPQPGHHVGFSGLLKTLISSNGLVSSIGKNLTLDCRDDLIRRDRTPIVFIDSPVDVATGVLANDVRELAGVV